MINLSIFTPKFDDKLSYTGKYQIWLNQASNLYNSVQALINQTNHLNYNI